MKRPPLVAYCTLVFLFAACGDDDSSQRDAAGDVLHDSVLQDGILQDSDLQDTVSDDTASDAPSDTTTDTSELCGGVDCGNGSCSVEDGAAVCICDPGYHPEALYCRADACEGEACPMSVSDWQALFDEEYENPRRGPEDCQAISRSGGTEQEFYFLSYCVDGLVSMWRATGDDGYLDEVLDLVQNTMNDLVVHDDGYRGWSLPDGEPTYPLWDSYYWRHVVTLLRIMHANPDVLTRSDYQAQYDALLQFTIEDLWGGWTARGAGNLYRSRTHMASHWARIGMNLYVITGETQYLEVFDNISHGTMPNRPSNLREQFTPNEDHPTAYNWASVWGDTPSDSVQDTSHAGAIVTFINEAASLGIYWTEADQDALASTLMDVIWEPALDGAYHQNVDGTDPTSGAFTGPYGQPGRLGGRLHEWLVLGQDRREVQDRIETYYLDPTRRNVIFFGYQAFGIGALNERILTDGRAYY